MNSGEIISLAVDGTGAAYRERTGELFFISQNGLYSMNLRTSEQKEICRFQEKQSDATIMKLDEQERNLLIAGREIHLIDLDRNQLKYTIPAKRFRFDAMLFDPYRDGLLFNGGEGVLTYMDMESNSILSEKYYNGQITDMIIDSKGEYLITASDDSVMTVQSWERGYEYSYSFNSNQFISLSTDPTGTYLAASVADSIYVFELKTGKFIQGTDLGYPDFTKKVIYSPNGRDMCLIINSVIAIYDMEDEDFTSIWKDTTGSIESYAYSSDGSYLAVGGYCDSIRIYDTRSMKQAFAYPIMDDYVGALAFLLESYDLFSGDRSGKINRFKYLEGQFEHDQVVTPHYSDVTRISFSKKARSCSRRLKKGRSLCPILKQ